MLHVECPSCGKGYQVADQSLRSRARCKNCGHEFTLAAAVDETQAGAEQQQRDGEALPPGQQSGPLAENSKLAQYVLKQKLGAGGMGEVWLANDELLERDVAIKILPAAIAHDAKRKLRFTREARLAARLNHPNAVVVYQFGIEEDCAFIVMELIDGASLDKVVAADGPLDWQAATQVICDAAHGLAAAHEIGLVHRDIKPANLIRTAKGVTKVVDFGLAREQLSDAQITREGAILGTPTYMAPEQWRGKAVDARADLYSLTCTYYYLLTGRAPFEAAMVGALGYLHQHEPFPDPRQWVGELPDAVCRILVRGSQKHPAQRYKNAAQLIADLEALLTAPEVPLISTSSPGRNQSLPPRDQTSVFGGAARALATRLAIEPGKRWIIAACAVGVLLLLCAVIVFWPTPNGTVKIEIDDPQAIVLVDREKIAVERLGKPIELRAGEHELIVRRGDVAVETRSFTIVRGQNPVLRITLLDDVAAGTNSVAALRPPATTPGTDVTNNNPAGPQSETPSETPTRLPEQTNTPTIVSSIDFTNSVGMKFKRIEAGEYLMGQTPDEPSRFSEKLDSDEVQHRVRLTVPFMIGVTEITQRQWNTVMGTTPWSGQRMAPEGDEYPANYISWNAATAFCQRLSQMEGRDYRLPTESEWEYCCRAGTTTSYSFGDDTHQLGQYAWERGNSNDQPQPVGHKRANPWGLYDMHGNVWEWCSEWYGDYPTSQVVDPTGPSAGTRRIRRGGGFWALFRKDYRSAERASASNGVASSEIGFRVALNIK